MFLWIGLLFVFLIFFALSFFLLKHFYPVWPYRVGLSSVVGFFCVVCTLIYDDMTWYGRVSSSLPSAWSELNRYRYESPWHPWSYALDIVGAASFYDPTGAKRHGVHQDLVMIPVYFIQRYGQSHRIFYAVSCSNHKLGILPQNLNFDHHGRPVVDNWIHLPSSHSIWSKVCSYM